MIPIQATGVGKNLIVVVIVGGQKAVAPSNQLISYAPPEIYSIDVVNGAIGSLNVAGNDIVYVEGNNFGPETFPPGFAPFELTYGPYKATLKGVTPNLDRYRTLVTAPGIGLNHAITVTVAGQSVTYSRPFSYKNPIILSVTDAVGSPLTKASTSGGDTFHIRGNDLGIPGSQVVVTYGPVTNRQKYTAAGCAVSNSSFVSCSTAPGTGIEHGVRLSVRASAMLTCSLLNTGLLHSHHTLGWRSILEH